MLDRSTSAAPARVVPKSLRRVIVNYETDRFSKYRRCRCLVSIRGKDNTYINIIVDPIGRFIDSGPVRWDKEVLQLIVDGVKESD